MADTSASSALPDTTQPPPPETDEPSTQPADLEDATLDTKHEQDVDAEITSAGPPAAAESMTTDVTMDGTTESQVTAAQPPAPAADSNGLGAIPAVVEPRIPQKKDTSLREFLGKMDDYAPLIPDAVTDYYLTLAGLPPPPETDRRLARLLALATQKFIADIAADAYQYSRIRSTNTTSNNPMTGLGGAAGFSTNMPQGGGAEGEGGGKGKKDAGKAAPLGGPRAGYGGGGGQGGQGRTVLTMEDLGMAVGEYGVNVKRGEFYR